MSTSSFDDFDIVVSPWYAAETKDGRPVIGTEPGTAYVRHSVKDKHFRYPVLWFYYGESHGYYYSEITGQVERVSLFSADGVMRPYLAPSLLTEAYIQHYVQAGKKSKEAYKKILFTIYDEVDEDNPSAPLELLSTWLETHQHLFPNSLYTGFRVNPTLLTPGVETPTPDSRFPRAEPAFDGFEFNASLGEEEFQEMNQEETVSELKEFFVEVAEDVGKGATQALAVETLDALLDLVSSRFPDLTKFLEHRIGRNAARLILPILLLLLLKYVDVPQKEYITVALRHMVRGSSYEATREVVRAFKPVFKEIYNYYAAQESGIDISVDEDGKIIHLLEDKDIEALDVEDVFERLATRAVDTSFLDGE